MTNIRQVRAGITLTELLIATVIIAVMMGGVVSVNLALHTMDKQEQASLVLQPRLLAMSSVLRTFALAATGDAGDLGVRMHNVDLDVDDNFLCFRKDPAGTPTPADFSDDVWTCFTRRNAAGARTDWYLCPNNLAPAACIAGGVLVGQLAFDSFAVAPPVFGADTGFSLRLITRRTPSAAASADNPEASYTLSVYPTGHSF